MKRKFLVGLLSTVVAMVGLVGCSNGETAETTNDTPSIETESSVPGESATGTVTGEGNSVDGEFTIGISQFAQHGSLDNCREGFIEGLESEGFIEGVNVTFDLQNANADTGVVNQISQSFAANKVDLICAIATPSAQSAYNAVKTTDIPAVYTAVNDPIAAGLAKEDKSPVGNTTGTSDKLPVEKQLAMIREILPDAKTIGILYTTSEINSEMTVREYEALVEDYGFTLVTEGVSSLAEVPNAADSILGKVDCLNNLTDNTVVSALPTILNKANQKGIPVFGSEIEQVKIGCLAAEGIDYRELGQQTGVMAAKILKGEKASEMEFELITDSKLYLNEKVAEQLNVTLQDEVKDRAEEIFTSID